MCFTFYYLSKHSFKYKSFVTTFKVAKMFGTMMHLTGFWTKLATQNFTKAK